MKIASIEKVFVSLLIFKRLHHYYIDLKADNLHPKQ
jgi:hypothetical protein